MTLSAGSRLGPYEITAAIGAGGMGEVFRARDTNLNRDVAIKVLPAAFADDPERLARFTREAQTLASLNHPNIATIHGIEEVPASGSSGPGSRALVMELVEGEDLSTHIARGPMPVAEALPIARQIAEALETAHEHGIVHRDLKPANIKVRPDGAVKVLDFGLAKAMGSGDASSNSNLSHSPTLTHRGTSTGMIIGTAAYMSPEQAKGKAVDKRADIWAFGVVLYEMLTGTRLFKGEDVSDTLAAVLRQDIDLKPLPPDTPPRLTRLIGRCLDRDIKTRLRDIGEARVKIAQIETGVPDRPTTSAASAPAKGPALPWAVAVTLGVGLLVSLARWAPWAPRPLPEPISFTLDPPAGTTFPNNPAFFAVSPDGRQIAFLTGERPNDKLWVRPLGSLTSTMVRNGDGASNPTWSPDSRSIVFLWGEVGRTVLKRVDVEGGPAVSLAESPLDGPAWNAQGVILYTGGVDHRIYRVAETGGPSTPVTELDKARQETSHAWPRFLPDGRRFIYSALSNDPAKSALFLASLDSPVRTWLVDVPSMAEYVPGHLLYLRDGTLMAHPFDEKTGRMSGEPRPVVESIDYNVGNGRAAFAVSSQGVLVYRAAYDWMGVLAWFDRTGKQLGTVGASADFAESALSPEGHRFVAAEHDLGRKHTNLFMIDLDRGVSTQFTSDDADEHDPLWSPDGQSVVFASNRKGVFDLYMKGAGGAEAERVLFESPSDKFPTGFSPDGRTLLFCVGRAADRRLWALPMAGSPKPFQLFPGSSEPEDDGRFSPDGRWIAYAVSKRAERRADVFVQPFPPNGVKTQISTANGASPRWTADGKEIVYATRDGRYMSVDVTTAGGKVEVTVPKELFVQHQRVTGGTGFSMDTSGKRFLLVVAPSEAGTKETPPPLTVVVNWASTLSRKK